MDDEMDGQLSLFEADTVVLRTTYANDRVLSTEIFQDWILWNDDGDDEDDD